MTLNYWMMVERYPNLKEEVDSAIPGCEISFILNKTLGRWSIAYVFIFKFIVKKPDNIISIEAAQVGTFGADTIWRFGWE